MLLVCIRSYLKSVLRYKFWILDTYHPDTLYWRKQGYEDPWLFYEAKGVHEENILGNTDLGDQMNGRYNYINSKVARFLVKFCDCLRFSVECEADGEKWNYNLLYFICSWYLFVIGFFHWHNPSGRTMALGSTQPLTEMSTRNISWGVNAAGA
jgi:hypothetical protein